MTARQEALAYERPLAMPLLFVPRHGQTAALARALHMARQPDLTGRPVELVTFTPADEQRALQLIASSALARHRCVRELVMPTVQRSGLGPHAESALAGRELDEQTRLGIARSIQPASRVAWLLDDPSIADEHAMRIMREAETDSDIPIALMHDLIDSRPGLLAAVAELRTRAAAGAATSLLLPADLASRLLEQADPRTRRGRAVLRELALNPAVSEELRTASVAVATRSWKPRRRDSARLHASDVVPVHPWQLLSDLTPEQGRYLASWAGGGHPDDGWAAGSGLPGLDRGKPAVLRRMSNAGLLNLEQEDVLHPSQTAMRMLGYLRPCRGELEQLAGQVLPAQLGGPPSRSPSRGTLLDQVIAAIPWNVPVRQDRMAGRLIVLPACAHSLRVEFNDSIRAWETYAALAPEWDGTLGELIVTCRSLA